MTSVDYFVFAFFLAGSLAIGGYYYFANKSSEDMFVAKGQSTWWMSGLSSFMTVFSAATFVVWGGIAYEYGVVALSVNMTYGIAAFLIGFFFAKKWKDLGVSSPADYLRERFGTPAVHLYLWVFGALRLIGVGVQLYGLSILLTTIMPLPEGHPFADPSSGRLSVNWAIFLFGTVIVVYTMTGGLLAVLMTDVVQFIVLTTTVLFLVPLMFIEVGSLNNFTENLPAGYFDLTSSDFPLIFLLGWLLINMFSMGAEWAYVQRYIAVKGPNEAKKTAFLMSALYIVSPFIWLAPAFMYRSIDPAADPERAYILASQLVLPIGMLGMMASAMFSATASSFSSQLNVLSGALTKQIFQLKLRPNSTNKELAWAGRVITLLLGSITIGLAFTIPKLGGAADVVIAKSSLVSGTILAPILWSLFSKKLNPSSIWIVVFTSLIVATIVKGLFESEAFLNLAPVFSGPADWVKSEPRLANQIVGVLTPLCVLLLFELFGKKKLFNFETPQREISVIDNQGYVYSSTPAWIVIIAVMSCASIIFIATFFAGESKAPMFLFCAFLLMIAFVIRVMMKRVELRQSSTVKGRECRYVETGGTLSVDLNFTGGSYEHSRRKRDQT